MLRWPQRLLKHNGTVNKTGYDKRSWRHEGENSTEQGAGPGWRGCPLWRCSGAECSGCGGEGAAGRAAGGSLGGAGSLAAQQGSQQKHSGHRRPGQEPFVEGLLAFSHLGSSIVPIEVHKALLWGEEGGEHSRGKGWQESRGGDRADDRCLVLPRSESRTQGKGRSTVMREEDARKDL